MPPKICEPRRVGSDANMPHIDLNTLSAAQLGVLRAFVSVVRMQRYESVVVQWRKHEVWYDIAEEGQWPRNAVSYNWLKKSNDPLLWCPDMRLLYIMP